MNFSHLVIHPPIGLGLVFSFFSFGKKPRHAAGFPPFTLSHDGNCPVLITRFGNLTGPNFRGDNPFVEENYGHVSIQFRGLGAQAIFINTFARPLPLNPTVRATGFFELEAQVLLRIGLRG